MLITILYTIMFLTVPAGMMWLCRKVKWLGKIGPVLLLYFLGVFLGNIGYKPQGLETVQTILSNAAVPLAIPLMLFGCTFRRSETRSQLLSVFLGVFAVAVAIVLGYFLFARDLKDGAAIGGMMAACYTGGVVNFAALKTMLHIDEGTFILLNSYHLLVSFFYLLFLLLVGVKLFRRFLPNLTNKSDDGSAEEIGKLIEAERNKNPYKGLFTRAGMKEFGLQFGYCLLVLLASVAVTAIALVTGLVTMQTYLPVLFLSITTLSIGASFLKTLKNRKYGYDVGMYIIYIFCFVVATQADARNLDIAAGIDLFLYLSFTIFGSLFIQVLLAKIFKVDADTTVISSVAFICSPAMVPMMAAGMNNKRTLAPGLAIGVIGYAVGNYLGFVIAKLLMLV